MASGTSTRMKKNKLLIDFFGKPLIQWTIEVVKKCDFKNIIVVYKDKEIKEIADKLGVQAIYNENFKKGQSESIKKALSYLKENYNGFMFFTGDQPLIKRHTILSLMETFKVEGGIVIPKVNGRNKSPVIFSSEFKEELMDIKGDIGGRVVIKNNINKIITINFTDSVEFFDIDTEEDLNTLISMYKGRLNYEGHYCS